LFPSPRVRRTTNSRSNIYDFCSFTNFLKLIKWFEIHDVSMMLTFHMLLVSMIYVDPLLWRWETTMKHDDEFENFVPSCRGVWNGGVNFSRSGDILRFSLNNRSPVPITITIFKLLLWIVFMTFSWETFSHFLHLILILELKIPTATPTHHLTKKHNTLVFVIIGYIFVIIDVSSCSNNTVKEWMMCYAV